MSEKKSYNSLDISLVSNKQLSFKTGAFAAITGAFVLGTSLLGIDAYFFPEKREYEESRVIENVKSGFFKEVSLVASNVFENHNNLQNIVEVPLYFNFISSMDMKSAQNQDISELIAQTTRLISYSPANLPQDSIEDLVLNENSQSISEIVSDINNIYSLNGVIYYALPVDLSLEDSKTGDFKNSSSFRVFEKVYNSSTLSEGAVKGILLSGYDNNVNSLEQKNFYSSINSFIKDDFGFKGDIKLGFELKNVGLIGEDLVNNYTHFVKCYGIK